MNGDLSPREKMKTSVIENHKKEERDRDRASPRSDSSSASNKHNKEVTIATILYNNKSRFEIHNRLVERLAS